MTPQNYIGSVILICHRVVTDWGAGGWERGIWGTRLNILSDGARDFLASSKEEKLITQSFSVNQWESEVSMWTSWETECLFRVSKISSIIDPSHKWLSEVLSLPLYLHLNWTLISRSPSINGFDFTCLVINIRSRDTRVVIDALSRPLLLLLISPLTEATAVKGFNFIFMTHIDGIVLITVSNWELPTPNIPQR